MGYLDKLEYFDGSTQCCGVQETPRWSVLPSWARFFGDVGGTIARFNFDESRGVVALSVPADPFCSTMLMVGAVTELAATFDAGLGTERGHTRFLRSLLIGDKVVFGGRIEQRGEIEGFEHWLGEEYLKIKVSSGSRTQAALTQLLTSDRWSEVRLDPNEKPIVRNPKPGIPVDNKYQLASALLHGHDIDAFYDDPSIECLVICSRGRLGSFEREVRHTGFAVSTGTSEKRQTGNLHDILQTKRFCGVGDVPKSEAWSSEQPAKEVLADIGIPKLVVFDGASVFSKWNPFFGKSNWAVVLDRTDANYLEGTLQLNGDFLNRDPNAELSFEGECPRGVDLMHYVGRHFDQ